MVRSSMMLPIFPFAQAPVPTSPLMITSQAARGHILNYETSSQHQSTVTPLPASHSPAPPRTSDRHSAAPSIVSPSDPAENPASMSSRKVIAMDRDAASLEIYRHLNEASHCLQGEDPDFHQSLKENLCALAKLEESVRTPDDVLIPRALHMNRGKRLMLEALFQGARCALMIDDDETAYHLYEKAFHLLISSKKKTHDMRFYHMPNGFRFLIEALVGITSVSTKASLASRPLFHQAALRKTLENFTWKDPRNGLGFSEDPDAAQHARLAAQAIAILDQDLEHMSEEACMSSLGTLKDHLKEMFRASFSEMHADEHSVESLQDLLHEARDDEARGNMLEAIAGYQKLLRLLGPRQQTNVTHLKRAAEGIQEEMRSNFAIEASFLGARLALQAGEDEAAAEFYHHAARNLLLPALKKDGSPRKKGNVYTRHEHGYELLMEALSGISLLRTPPPASEETRLSLEETMKALQRFLRKRKDDTLGHKNDENAHVHAQCARMAKAILTMKHASFGPVPIDERFQYSMFELQAVIDEISQELQEADTPPDPRRVNMMITAQTAALEVLIRRLALAHESGNVHTREDLVRRLLGTALPTSEEELPAEGLVRELVQMLEYRKQLDDSEDISSASQHLQNNAASFIGDLSRLFIRMNWMEHGIAIARIVAQHDLFQQTPARDRLLREAEFQGENTFDPFADERISMKQMLDQRKPLLAALGAISAAVTDVLLHDEVSQSTGISAAIAVVAGLSGLSLLNYLISDEASEMPKIAHGDDIKPDYAIIKQGEDAGRKRWTEAVKSALATPHSRSFSDAVWTASAGAIASGAITFALTEQPALAALIATLGALLGNAAHRMVQGALDPETRAAWTHRYSGRTRVDAYFGLRETLKDSGVMALLLGVAASVVSTGIAGLKLIEDRTGNAWHEYTEGVWTKIGNNYDKFANAASQISLDTLANMTPAEIALSTLHIGYRVFEGASLLFFATYLFAPTGLRLLKLFDIKKDGDILAHRLVSKLERYAFVPCIGALCLFVDIRTFLGDGKMMYAVTWGTAFFVLLDMLMNLINAGLSPAGLNVAKLKEMRFLYPGQGLISKGFNSIMGAGIQGQVITTWAYLYHALLAGNVTEAHQLASLVLLDGTLVGFYLYLQAVTMSGLPKGNIGLIERISHEWEDTGKEGLAWHQRFGASLFAGAMAFFDSSYSINRWWRLFSFDIIPNFVRSLSGWNTNLGVSLFESSNFAVFSRAADAWMPEATGTAWERQNNKAFKQKHELMHKNIQQAAERGELSPSELARMEQEAEEELTAAMKQYMKNSTQRTTIWHPFLAFQRLRDRIYPAFAFLKKKLSPTFPHLPNVRTYSNLYHMIMGDVPEIMSEETLHRIFQELRANAGTHNPATFYQMRWCAITLAKARNSETHGNAIRDFFATNPQVPSLLGLNLQNYPPCDHIRRSRRRADLHRTLYDDMHPQAFEDAVRSYRKANARILEGLLQGPHQEDRPEPHAGQRDQKRVVNGD